MTNALFAQQDAYHSLSKRGAFQSIPASMNAMQIDPANLAVSERYKLLVGAVVPRPIAFISTIDEQGRANLAPFSFFNGVSGEPMALLFCPANKPDGSEKHTLVNVATTGQFVVNIVSDAIARRMAVCAEDLPIGESEFALAGLTEAPSTKVAPPRVAESPLSLECEVERIIRLAPGEPSGGNVVIGRVVFVHAADGLIDERCRVDPAQLAAIGRMAGLTYCSTRDRFDMPWGRNALEEA